MPIASAIPVIQSQLQSIARMGISGTPDLTAVMIASILASAVPSGLFIGTTPPTPLVPTGISATQSILNSTFQMGISGTSEVSSQLMASAIAALCPIVPPIGLSLLKNLLQNISNLGITGSPELTSQILANAIVNYFMSGLVI